MPKLPLELRKERREAQRRRATEANGEVVIADTGEATEEQNETETDTPIENKYGNRRFTYPLSEKLEEAPARIVFTSYNVEGLDIGDLFQNVGLGSRADLDDADDLTDEEKEAIEAGEAEEVDLLVGKLQSYRNFERGRDVGSVTLPLYNGLKFTDGAQYNVAELGVVGAFASGGGLTTDDGKLGGAMGAVMGQLGVKALGATAGGLVGNSINNALEKAGKGGGAVAAGLGGLAGFDLGSSLATNLQSATRVTTSPNQRTLFERVELRGFQFQFKLIANNEAETREIYNIVKFFRTEVYPEAVRVREGGEPFAYNFPNVFQIDIKTNRSADDKLAPKIQRCYLTSVDTSFNSTASGFFETGEGPRFVEVDISLSFKEIATLDKDKVFKDGF